MDSLDGAHGEYPQAAEEKRRQQQEAKAAQAERAAAQRAQQQEKDEARRAAQQAKEEAAAAVRPLSCGDMRYDLYSTDLEASAQCFMVCRGTMRPS